MISLPNWPVEARPLIERVARWIRQSLAGTPNEALETLALDIHAYHCAYSPIAKALTAGPVTRIHEIPAIPVQLYKELPIGTVPQDIEGVTFLTSGTTSEKRGAHRMYHASLYELAATAWARAFAPNLPHTGAHLLLDPKTYPESSLSHMAQVLCGNGASWHLNAGTVDASSFIDATQKAKGPLFIGATAFALAQFIEKKVPCSVPDGSVLMVTGGFKGHKVSLSDEALYQETAALFHNATLLTEYGMTELSSQLWGYPNGRYTPPPWMRVWACDPITGHPLPADTLGQLRFFDLANVDSALVVETMDQGMVDAQGCVQLVGRISQSELRGCSLTAEAGLDSEPSK